MRVGFRRVFSSRVHSDYLLVYNIISIVLSR